MLIKIIRRTISAYRSSPKKIAFAGLKAFIIIAVSTPMILSFYLCIPGFLILPLALNKKKTFWDIVNTNNADAANAPCPLKDRSAIKTIGLFICLTIITILSIYAIFMLSNGSCTDSSEEEINDTIISGKIIIYMGISVLLLIVPFVLIRFLSKPYEIAESLAASEAQISGLDDSKHIKSELLILNLVSAVLLLSPLISPFITFAAGLLFDNFLYHKIDAVALLLSPALAAAVFYPLRGLILAAAATEFSLSAQPQTISQAPNTYTPHNPQTM